MQNFAALFTLLIFSLVSFSVPAQAQFKDVCTLAATPLPVAQKITAGEKASYFLKLSSECQLQKRYLALEKEIKTYYGLSLQNVTVYHALRYVQRYFYEQAKSQNVPLEVLYQRTKADYALPVNQRPTEIWDNWTIGLRQLPPFIEKLQRDPHITLEDIKTIHKGFFVVGTEVGDYSNPLTPGQMKGPKSGTVNWYKITPDSRVRSFQLNIDNINKRYNDLLLLPSPVAGDSTAHLPIRVRQLAADQGYYFYSAAAEMVETHMNNILRLLNHQLEQGARGEHMFWNGRPLTPGETAYLVQQFFVHVHPFLDGNGRTSRFLQEAILSLFQLPFGSSGDLMAEDMTTPQGDYYALALAKNKLQLEAVSYCLTKVYPQVFYRTGNIMTADPQSMPYDCRLVFDKSPR
jgi:hypothetical protein